MASLLLHETSSAHKDAGGCMPSVGDISMHSHGHVVPISLYTSRHYHGVLKSVRRFDFEVGNWMTVKAACTKINYYIKYKFGK